ncbi:MAG: hypothetical protein ACOC8X_07075 [Chloroflexota bacterium]
MSTENQTYLDLVRQHFGDHVTVKEADHLLWNATGFPVYGDATVARQVKEAAERSGKDIERAVELAYEELDKAMEQARAERDGKQ